MKRNEILEAYARANRKGYALGSFSPRNTRRLSQSILSSPFSIILPEEVSCFFFPKRRMTAFILALTSRMLKGLVT